MEGLIEGHRREKNHCEWVTARNLETVASIRLNFHEKQQPIQILELNAGYYFQSAADKVRIWNEVHHQDPRQSVSVHSEQTSLLQQDIKPEGEEERVEERATRLLKLTSNGAEKERRYGKKTKELMSASKT